MLDKEISARLCPRAAFWATNGVVNGLGKLAQKFWLANNLIAQIPGNSEPAREHSIDWALKGNVVLLHAEGAVGWHSNYVAPLMPGAVEMANEALKRGRAADPGFQAFVAPVVWKLVFERDVEPKLLSECAYVEGRLKIEPGEGLSLPERAYRLYETLLEWDEEDLGIEEGPAKTFAGRHRLLVAAVCRKLAELLALDKPLSEPSELLRIARRRLREAKSDPAAPQIKSAIDRLALNLRLGAYAFDGETVTQEELAEHIKRIRNDYCKGTMRDTLNRYVPRPAGPRTAIIRVPEAIAMHEFEGSVEDALMLLRGRMREALDDINGMLAVSGRLTTYPNPFHAGPIKASLTPKSKQWVAIAQQLTSDPARSLTCPFCGNGTLVVHDVPFDPKGGFERWINCPHCNEHAAIRHGSQISN
ncbi:hypothetical protein [Mesorhizobium sp. KR9-304]|uniref:hypothetical protein n=1 Tax=Mesorhizobium sp. KR9-304 TaxID=3156614 RepID=UPI0032B315BC